MMSVCLQVLQCSSRSWQPSTFPGGILVGVRVVVALVAGVCLDVFGRRRSIVAWMGLYFVVAFARSFSPNAESVVFCISLEGAAAQASTLALLLLGLLGAGSLRGRRRGRGRGRGYKH